MMHGHSPAKLQLSWRRVIVIMGTHLQKKVHEVEAPKPKQKKANTRPADVEAKVAIIICMH
jgi:hypothetical protein